MEQATRNIGKDDSITDEEREMLPMQQQQFLTMPPELHPKTLTNDTFTAWEKKPSKEKIKIPPQRPPQDKVVPVNFSVPESRHPKQIAAVETVEPEAKPRGLEVHVLSTSKDAKDLTAAPTQPSPEPTQEEMASPSCRPGATCQTIHEKLPEETEPPSTVKRNDMALGGSFPEKWLSFQKERENNWLVWVERKCYHLALRQADF